MKEEEDKDHQSSWSANECSSTGAGEEFNPSDSTEEAASAEPPVKQAVPIGRPVSDEEYDRMKERAAQHNPSSGEHKQQDPSHRKPDKQKET